MIGDQGRKNDKTNGQRVSRHSLPTFLCFIFFTLKFNFYSAEFVNTKVFPTAQNILKYEVFTNTIINKSSVSKFYASPQMAHLVLPDIPIAVGTDP